jgi:hypothetical protein
MNDADNTQDLATDYAVSGSTTAVPRTPATAAALTFATQRAELETRWTGGNQVSTEELRQGLRLYRSFFERLLAA